MWQPPDHVVRTRHCVRSAAARDLAEKAGAIAIDDTEGEGVEKIMELTGGQGLTVAASASVTRAATCTGRKCRT